MSFTRAIDFIKFRFTSGNQYGLHSPFVYSLYTEVIRKDKNTPKFTGIEEKRTELTLNLKRIPVVDYGAGRSKSSERRVSKIAKRSLKPPRQSRLLYRLIEKFQPEYIIELGTSLGLTTSYMAMGNPNGNLYTFEGSPEIAAIAQKNFKEFRLRRVRIIQGDINTKLEEALEEIPQVDFVFFDANHRYEPTIEYFKLCFSKAHENSVFVFDDIYWSDEMKKAWSEIKAHKDVTLTIDLFHFGLVFFRDKQPKQHFKLRY